ncbi:MAG: cytochrome c biogenesis protein CcsA [Bacillota bacterium]
MGDQWIKTTRRWSVIAWMFLSLGNLTGAQWAYVELGWGGFWAWDPVENASFVPWLTATAFIHSVMIQERKGLLKIWNMVLIMITYLLTLFGTYLVRSGVIVSVHAFGTSQLGHFFLGFLIFMALLSAYFLLSRLHLLREEGSWSLFCPGKAVFC